MAEINGFSGSSGFQFSVLDIFRFVTLDFFGHNKLKNYFSEDEVQLLQRHKGIVISGSSTIN